MPIALRATTLIELLTTLAISVMVFYVISPPLFRLHDHMVLNQQLDHIKSFVYQVQAKARYQKQNYALTVHQSEAEKSWCVIAVAKTEAKVPACNCLDLTSCHLTGDYLLHHQQHTSVILKNNSLYPKVWLDLDGKSGQMSSGCINLSLNHLSEVLQFNKYGVINVAQQNKRTTCR